MCAITVIKPAARLQKEPQEILGISRVCGCVALFWTREDWDEEAKNARLRCARFRRVFRVTTMARSNSSPHHGNQLPKQVRRVVITNTGSKRAPAKISGIV